jgi:hypothetical protein
MLMCVCVSEREKRHEVSGDVFVWKKLLMLMEEEGRERRGEIRTKRDGSTCPPSPANQNPPLKMPRMCVCLETL